MPPSRDDDLDWLYGRNHPAAEPERTRVLSPADLAQPTPTGSPAPRVAPRVPPGAEPAPLPSSYPGMPAYGQGRPDGRAPFGQPGSPVPPAPTGAPPLKKRRRPVRAVLVTLLVLVLAGIVWLVGVPLYAWSHVARVDDAPAGTRPADQPGQTFLLVGSDSREGLTKAQQKKLGTGSVGGQRTDTIMLLYVPTTGKPALISIPRDSYVAIPKNGKNKINAAFQFGGAPLLVQTIESDTGLRVDGYLEVGFGGFVSVIDAIDGIRLCLPNAIKDRDSHIDLPKGCQTLSGTEALGYVRERKADPLGDLGRVQRQRQMLAAVAKKAASPASILNPVSYWRLCNASTASIKPGQETSLFAMARLALAMKAISAGNGLTLTVPVSNVNASTPAGSAVLWDDAKAKAMFKAIAAGDTADLSKYATK